MARKRMQNNRNITRVYITDYEGEVREMLDELNEYLEERDRIINALYVKRKNFLLSKKEVIKQFLEERDYRPSRSYEPDRMNETFYCEENAHLLTLFIFNFLHIVVSSGSQIRNYRIDVLIGGEKPDFRNTVLVEGIDKTIGFYGVPPKEVTSEFIKDQLEKARHNIKIFREKLENFNEDDLIYSYNDIERISLVETLSMILNETRI
ncbi:MAG: hypothetical protein Q4P31_01385 [Andreesenia angusta]|nr:hypothetical protein [Andreesenia angusta]